MYESEYYSSGTEVEIVLNERFRVDPSEYIILVDNNKINFE